MSNPEIDFGPRCVPNQVESLRQTMMGKLPDNLPEKGQIALAVGLAGACTVGAFVHLGVEGLRHRFARRPSLAFERGEA